jgi:DNA-binding SARP family transcriptional activator/streptogramin lyase
VEYRILGPLEIQANGELIRLGPAKERALLGILLLHANDVVAGDRLVEELWGERPPESAGKLVHVYVSRLRKTLEQAGAKPVVETRAPGYVATVGDNEIDAARFERLVADAHSSAAAGDFEAALTTYEAALGLWRGRVLADVTFESLARNEADRLEESRVTALAERADCMLELGRHEELVGELEALVAEHPLRERFRAQLMLALYRSGRQSDALGAYQDARRLLVEQLGIEPGHELKELERAILHQDPALNPPRTVAPAAEGVRRPRLRMLALASAVVALVTLAVSFLAFRDSDASARTLEPRSIGRIDPTSNRIASEIPIGATPVLATTSRRAVWVATREGTLTRVDPDRQRVVATLILGGEPSGLAAGAGSVWVGDALEHTVARIDATHNVVGPPISLPKPALRAAMLGPAGPALAVGGGFVWVSSGRTRIARIDPQTRKIELITPRGGANSAIAYGEGALWVGGPRAVTRISRASNRAIRLPETPTALAVGYGSVWVASRSAAKLFRIDAETEAVETITIEGPATAVAVGHGAVWLALAPRGAVLRIDPARNEVDARIAVGGAPISLAVSPAGVWVGVS